MLHLRPSDADRERLGCPELLPLVTATSITNREAVALQRIGYPTPAAFGRALDKGEGEVDYDAWTALLWLGLRRVGVDVDLETLEFEVLGLRVVNDEDVAPKEQPGKAPARGRSGNSRRKSSTSTATSGPRLTPTGSPS